MSFKAKFKIDGSEWNIMSVTYDLHQTVDDTGRPSSITRGGRIKLSVESTGDPKFFEWMCNNFERKDGEIEFTKRDTDAKLKVLNFTEAYLVKYEETFDAINKTPLMETFVLSAREISMGGGNHVNDWV